MSGQRTIVLAAGGTGGHIFPAEALTEELARRGHKVCFVTDKRFADYSSASLKGILGEIPIFYIRAGTLGKGMARRAAGGYNIVAGVLQARKLLGKVKPDVVVGFGGYPSFPTMIAALSRRMPTIIHEQNALLGRANRVLASRVTRIAASFENTGFIKNEDKAKITLVGNPVRSAIRALHEVPAPELKEDGIMQILILGGSQGASVFGDIMPKAVALLPEVLRKRLRIDQQVRAHQLDATRAAYEAMGVHVTLDSFFADVPARLAGSHLVISRAGASTVAEITCAGRPAILVPYPEAADNHQKINASAMEDAGGAWLMPQEAFTPDALAARLESFLTLPASLSKAAKAAHSLGRPGATGALADLVLAEAARRQGESYSSTPALHMPGGLQKDIAA